MIRLALFCCLIALCPDAYGQTVPVCDAAITLRHLDLMPCQEGVLFPPGWALEAVRLKTVLFPKCIADLELESAEHDADTALSEAELSACRRFSATQSDLLEKALELTSPPPWYKSPVLWGVVGGIVGAAGGGSLVYVVLK